MDVSRPPTPHARSSRRFILGLLALCGATVFEPGLQASTPLPPEGAQASRNYLAPIDLRVVDVSATVAAANAAGELLPLVVREHRAAREVVVGEFDSAFRRTRSAYMDALETTFGETTIGSREINSSRFRAFRSEFQAANPLFPVNHVLAQTWAKGYDGENTRERLARALGQAMSRGLMGDVRPASTVFVTALQPGDRINSWGEAAAHCRPINRSEILSIEAAGQELRQGLDILDRGAGGFMTGLLRANFVEDEYLTSLLFDERLGDKAVRRSYRAGEAIVRAGDIVDSTALLALTHLTRRGLNAWEKAPDPVQTPPGQPAVETPVMPSPATAAPAEPALEYAPTPLWLTPSSWPRWMLIVAGSASGLLVIILGRLLFVRRSGRRREVPSSSDEWLDEPAPKADGNLREALIPHLARELKNRLVQALFAQRQALLHNEEHASARVAMLEERLAKLQPAIAEKIRGYERRIQALEAELEEKDQETRDLIRAKLVLARKELDAEITRHHAGWN